MCSSQDEDEEHSFFRCSTAKEFMARLKDWWDELPNLANLDSVDDLFAGQRRADVAAKIDVVIRAYMWVLWLHRNAVCFKCDVKGIAQLVSEVRAISFDWCKNKRETIWFHELEYLVVVSALGFPFLN